jgi:DNA-binding NarL/FixJ family response regulator
MRVVIAEDSVLLRAGLVRLLADHGHEVTAEAADAGTLLAAVDAEPPEIAIIDVRMPPDFSDEGVRAALEIRRRHPQVALLLLSQYVEERYARELLASETRAIGYLLKDRVVDVSGFLELVERIGAGGTAVDPEVVSQLLAQRPQDGALDELTPRERDVLALMAEGRSNAAISRQLVITEGAVEKHVGNILRKLELAPADDDHRRVLAVLAYLSRER